MSDTVETDQHRCCLCKKTFKQKSSLVRHAKRCTLEPRPSVRQKACRTCIVAKARCDLQRPACSRCNSRNIPCAYARPAKTITSQDCPSTSNSDSVANANVDLCGLITPDINLDTEAINIAGSDTNVSAYMGCDADFTSLSGAGPPHNCLVPELFPSGSVDTSDATASSESGFHSTYSTYPICGTTSTPATHHPHNHHSVGSCTESLETQLDLDSSSPRVDINLPVVSREDLGYVSPFCPAPTLPTTAAPDTDEIEPWILALAGKAIFPDSPRLVEHSAQTLFRGFRSWPRMLAKGVQLPPIIHPLQFCVGEGDIGGEMKMPKLIGRCVTLCKMWVGQAEGSGQVVENAVRGETECILAKYRTYDAPTLLAATQSLMVLMIILMFPSNCQSTLSVVPGHIFTAVQDLANYVLSTGMMLHEEATHVRPSWRIWAHIEAKRRTLMSIYFMHWAYSAYHGTRHFNCLQLGRMLATGPKWLWQATDEKTWMRLYARWLAQWDGKELVQAEFFLVERGPVMDSRVERWLEDADELGILIMTIMNASQRDLSKIPNAEANIVG
ncbi:hypothetical protein F5Y09DRAFT_325406 [Xylaria sp. FL1042]|nr:hypothetical protein F5Y09DRAFT_325406 [Xylaria sp. FL1042]